jgi:hypothetical protein
VRVLDPIVTSTSPGREEITTFTAPAFPGVADTTDKEAAKDGMRLFDGDAVRSGDVQRHRQ